MKKIIKHLSIILVIFFVLLGIINVEAKTYEGVINGHDYLSPKYYYMHVKGSREAWITFRYITRSTDGAFVYCVQPFAKIDGDAKYNVTTENIPSIMGISESTWKEISRIAYYGYMYKDSTHDHTTKKWYAATQMLIWNTVDPSVDTFFTKTLHGTRDDSILKSEQNEIMSLANSHLTKPNFSNMPTEMIIGDTITLTDTKGVLSGYNIVNVKGGIVTKEGNTLSITPTEVGTLSFNLQKLGNKYGEPINLYYVDDSQNVIRRGDIDPITLKNNITVIGGKVTAIKTDEDTYENMPQGEASLAGAIYGVYQEDGTKVGTVTTGENGKGTSDYLPNLGTFYLLEETPSKGYQLDTNKYYFDISTENLYPEIQVFEKVINLNFDFIKVYGNEQNGVMNPEIGVEFAVYNNKNEEIRHLTTDSQGNIKFNLPYGNYTLKQLTTTPGYRKVEDIKLEVKEIGSTVKRTISDQEVTAKLRVIKIDSETKKVVKRSGIKFKIFSLKNNEYVCQTITYPEIKTYCEFETNNNGEFITPFILNSGSYKLEEVDQKIDGYLWNRESHEFTIDENTELITDSEYGIIFDTQFENQRVKGEMIINKVGEKVIIKDNKITYTDEPLKGIKFCLYTNNDVEIKCDRTNEEGRIVFNNLELGDYYLLEKETLKDYILDKTKHDVSLKYKDQYTAVITYQTLLKNNLKKGSIEFTKTDLVNGEVIPNTKIEIYTEKDELVFEGITNNEGIVKVDNLPIGKYYIIESEAATGYIITDEKVLFEIKDNGEIVKAEMSNKPIIGSLEFSKIDLSTSEPLPNTKVEIYTEKDELVFSGVTNEEGKIVIEELKYGRYYILEKEAPNGYVLNTEKMYFEILNDGEIIKCTMTNEQVKVEVPITGAVDSYIPEILGAIFILLGLGLIIYEEKRKR